MMACIEYDQLILCDTGQTTLRSVSLFLLGEGGLQAALQIYLVLFPKRMEISCSRLVTFYDYCAHSRKKLSSQVRSGQNRSPDHISEDTRLRGKMYKYTSQVNQVHHIETNKMVPIPVTHLSSLSFLVKRL